MVGPYFSKGILDCSAHSLHSNSTGLLRHVRWAPPSRPCHWLFLQLGFFLSKIFIWLIPSPSCSSGLCWNDQQWGLLQLPIEYCIQSFLYTPNSSFLNLFLYSTFHSWCTACFTCLLLYYFFCFPSLCLLWRELFLSTASLGPRTMARLIVKIQ